MNLKAPKNPNYCATVVALDKFVPLPNSDRIQGAMIFGNQVIVGKDAKAGDVGLFFPVETQLSHAFIAANNLYRKAEWGNTDPTKTGFFEQSRRVKAVKMRGNKSEGFFIPVSGLSEICIHFSDIPIGAEFDELEGTAICCKYEVRPKGIQGPGCDKTKLRNEDKILSGQFHFHTDTENLRKNIHKLTPDMWISISDKWHGTSVIVSNLLVKRQLGLFSRTLKHLGANIMDVEYGQIWSSRRVVKGVDGVEKTTAEHFYGEDIWGIVAKELFSTKSVEKGITIYAEIVGYTPGGSPIQPGYAYGCTPGTHRTVVYRITSTNADGKVIEFSWNQIKAYCIKYGLEMVKELWHGLLSYLYTSAIFNNQSLLEHLEHLYIYDQDCPHNVPGTPAEGIVLKIDHLDHDEAYKLKNFRFLEHETKQLDAGVVDTESSEAASGGI